MSYRMGIMFEDMPPVVDGPLEVPGYVPSPTAPFVKIDTIGTTLSYISAINLATYRVFKTSTGTLLVIAGTKNQTSIVNPKIYRSVDNGVSFTQKFDANHSAARIFYKECIFEDDDGTIYLFYSLSGASEYLKIYKSIDDGITWELHVSRTMAYPEAYNGFFINFGNGVWFGNWGTGHGSYHTIFKTDDYGVTWNSVKTFGSGVYIQDVCVHGNSLLVRTLGTDCWISDISVDPFVFSKVSHTFPNSSSRSMIARTKTYSGKILMLCGSTISYSSDDGVTWGTYDLLDEIDEIDSNEYNMSISVRGKVVLIGGYINKKLWRSVDEGRNFTLVDALAGYTANFDDGNYYEKFICLDDVNNSLCRLVP